MCPVGDDGITVEAICLAATLSKEGRDKNGAPFAGMKVEPRGMHNGLESANAAVEFGYYFRDRLDRVDRVGATSLVEALLALRLLRFGAGSTASSGAVSSVTVGIPLRASASLA